MGRIMNYLLIYLNGLYQNDLSTIGLEQVKDCN